MFDDDNPGPPDYIRLPTFYQLDLRADKRFVFDRYVLDVYVEAVNTTLTREVFDVKREHRPGRGEGLPDRAAVGGRPRRVVSAAIGGTRNADVVSG